MFPVVTITLLSVGLAMDAFSVSIVSGIRSSHVTLSHALRIGICFGLFQAFMPLIGFVIGNALRDKVDAYSGYIACVLLVIVGAKMIYESMSSSDEDGPSHISTKELLSLGLATSIDALVIGTTLSLIKFPIFLSVTIIGLVTCVISVVGYMFGIRLGKIFGKKVEILGGVVLIGLGINFLF